MKEVVKYTCSATGKLYERHGFEYSHDGMRWDIDIWATSQADAEERISKMQFATYIGTLEGSIPAYPGAGLWVRFVCWLNNRKGRTQN